MITKSNEIVHCKEWQDIIDGLVPGVIIPFEDTRDGTEIYQDSLKVATSQMSRQEYWEKHSPYYQKNPHMRTIVKD
jgi:hypothetical protein